MKQLYDLQKSELTNLAVDSSLEVPKVLAITTI